MKKLHLVLLVCISLTSCFRSDPFYPIQGRVTGLDGSLTLQNNGGDDLTLTKNGSFLFDTTIVEGQPYDVTIKKGPTTGTCTVTKGEGIVREGMKRVTITCSGGVAGKQWVDPSSITDYFTFAGQNAQELSIAMDNNRNAIMTWMQFDGTRNRIYKAEYRNGVWTYPSSPADYISPAASLISFAPWVAMDRDENAIIVWQGSDGVNTQIFKSEYRNGTWTHPSSETDNISPDGTDCQNPRVEMDDDVNTIITWSQMDSGGQYQIFKSEYRSGVWTHPTDNDDNFAIDGQDAYGPAVIAMDNASNAVIAFSEWNGSEFVILKSEYRSGSWVHPAALNENISPSGQSADDAAVAMDNNGNAIIVWGQSDGSNIQTFKSEYRSGSWVHPASLADNFSVDGQNAQYPAVTMNDEGVAVIAWQQNDGTVNQIFKSEYRSGSWVHPASLTDNISLNGTDATDPAVKLNDQGTAIIAWTQDNGADTQIYRAEYREGEWSYPSSLSDHISPSGEAADLSVVAMDDDDNAIIGWRQSDGSNNQHFKSEYR